MEGSDTQLGDLLYIPGISVWKLCLLWYICNANSSPVCACLQGFVSKSPKNWNSVDWSDGCVRRTPLECNRVGFLKYKNVKLPNTSSSWFNMTMSPEGCEGLCLKNCSCTAYSNLDIRGKGSGCLLWFCNLNDTRVDQDGQDIYTRLANSEPGTFYSCYFIFALFGFYLLL